jgi:hypothetical protein
MPPARRASRHLTIACARCGRAAAEIALLPASAAGESPWHDRPRLERTDFLGTVTHFGPPDELEAAFRLLQQGQLEVLRGSLADFAAFFCWTCRLPYCESCWHPGGPVFDEGYYDYTLGTCPAGHEQIIDD